MSAEFIDGRIFKPPKFLTEEERKKVMGILDRINIAYWRIWFGRPIFNSVKLREDLTRAKKLIEELGI